LAGLPHVVVRSDRLFARHDERETDAGTGLYYSPLPGVSLNDVPMKGKQGGARYWIGLAAGADGRFHAGWIGDATGKRQVWTAAITVK